MGIQNDFRTWSIKAVSDIDSVVAGTGHIYKAVANDAGDIASSGKKAVGILQYAGETNDHVTIGFDGIMKYTASAAINSKDVLLAVTTSGYFKEAVGGEYVVGRALSIVSSGGVGTGMFSFIAPSVDFAAFEDFTTQADLSAAAALGHAVDFTAGDHAASANAADGVLVTGAASGGTATAQFQNKVQARAGGAITLGQSLTIGTSGWFTAGNSGDLLVGRALAASAAGNSGGLFSAALNLATPHYATNSLDVQY